MNSRLKLSILIVTTCFVVAGAIGIIAWAIAATNVGLNSTISVTYTAAQNVVCEASATYQKTTDTSATAFQSGTLNFAYGSATTSQTMTASSTAVVLNDTNTYVIFEYTFKNKNLMQDYRLRVQLTDNANCTNMTRKYYIGDLSKLSVSEKRNVIINGYDNSAISSQFFTMGYQETGRIYMLLEITLGVKANYSTSSSNPFSFALTTTDGYALNFDSNGGSVVNAKTVYSGSTYGTLPTPTRAGYTFKGWSNPCEVYDGKNLITPTTFTGSNYITLGRDYMFTDRISIVIKASKENWATYYERLISCTEGGGWNIEYITNSNKKYMQFAIYDAGTGYKPVPAAIPLSNLESGFHVFAGVFDGEYASFYIDGILVGKSAKFKSGKIGYHASNGIFVGAEAENDQTTPSSGSCFKGTISHVSIENSAGTAVATTAKISTTKDQQLTAIWEKN